MSKQPKQRDQNIQKAYQREINLTTKVVPDKSKYKRKEKQQRTFLCSEII